MRNTYTQTDLNSVIGQVSKEISNLTGMPKDELFPSLTLSDDLRLTSADRISLEVAFGNRFRLSPPVIDGMLGDSSFGKKYDDLSIEDVARNILHIRPDAAQVGEAYDAQLTPQTLAKKEISLPSPSKIHTHS